MFYGANHILIITKVVADLLLPIGKVDIKLQFNQPKIHFHSSPVIDNIR